jgi:hypothetical protein
MIKSLWFPGNATLPFSLVYFLFIVFDFLFIFPDVTDTVMDVSGCNHVFSISWKLVDFLHSHKDFTCILMHYKYTL